MYRFFTKVGLVFTSVCLLISSLYAQRPEGIADLELLGTYSTGQFDESAAEIPAYHAAKQRLYVVNAQSGKVDVISISNLENPELEFSMDIADLTDGGLPNSVAIHENKLAVAVEASNQQDSGMVLLQDLPVGDGPSNSAVYTFKVGVLPDMVTFSNDGKLIITANEGQPSDDYSVDPEGSISIIDISNGSENAVVTTLDFNAWDNQKESLMNKGVRIFGPGASVSQDLEPEYVAVSPDNSTAFVTLQENNAFAVVDLASKSIKDIIPLGYKNWNRGTPKTTEYILNEEVDNWPSLGTPIYEGFGNTGTVMLGGFSGMYFDHTLSTDEEYVFFAIPDRGPNEGHVGKIGTAANVRPFKLPDYQGRIVKFSLNIKTGTVSLDSADQIFLTAKDGTTAISGKGNIPGHDEVPVTVTDGTVYKDSTYLRVFEDNNNVYGADSVFFDALTYDRYGGDFEGVLKDKSGNFWMCDEHRPAIYKFDEGGKLIERYVPQGTSLLGDSALVVNSFGATARDAGFFGAEILPEVYQKRRGNRGFEAIAYDSASNIIYAFIQTPMDNPSSAIRHSDVIRILGVSATDGTPVSEYVYLLERNAASGHALNRVDKIGDAVYTGNGNFLVLERDSSDPNKDRRGKKFVFEINISNATNILSLTISSEMTENTLEQMTPKMLAEAGIKPVRKRKVVNLPSVGYTGSDKPEGIALLPNGSIAVLNDNDFGLAGAGVTDKESLGIISFEEGNMIDVSNRDDSIKFRRWPILGMYQPDAIASMMADGQTYYLTANEGDARDYDTFTEEFRIKDIGDDLAGYSISESIVKAAGFESASDLQEDENLGRLRFSSVMGRDTANKVYDQLFSYGARSFSVWDEFGNLIWDSGDQLEKITADVLGKTGFNATNDESGFDARSDDKGPEPEAVTIAKLNGRQYALIGLERVGGIIVYDVTKPWMPEYVTYINNRNFDIEFDPDNIDQDKLAMVGDLGPEGILFIEGKYSPNGKPVIVAANEVSGTTSILGINTNLDKEYGPAALNIEFEGSYDSGSGEGAAEISAYDPASYKLFTLNAEDSKIDIIDIKDPSKPVKVDDIDISNLGGGVNSIALKNGMVALAIEADNAQENGVVGLFNTDGDSLATYDAGALPDMVTFTPNGKYILVANEGEPSDDYKTDPEGSVTIINISEGVTEGTVTTASFTSFNDQKDQLIASGVRIFGPGASVAEDLEPEYITTTNDSIAYVILQENNALGILDIKTSTIKEVVALGFKDWSDLKIDASNRDGGINLKTYDNLYGIYQPDGATSYDINGKTYVFTANEGDAREYLVENGHEDEAACLADGGVAFDIDDDDKLCFFYINEARIKDLNLDAAVFPNAAELQEDDMLGRLKVDTSLGKNANGEFEKLYAFGGRSFSIWNGENGSLVWDSKDDFERISSVRAREIFNANDGGDPNEFDDRSDDKGAEPENVVVGKVAGKVYAFVGLERQGGFMVYDVTNPEAPKFDQYIRQEQGDASPEGMIFIPADQSPTFNSLVVLSNEVSGTVSIYSIGEAGKRDDFKLQLLHYADADGNEETALESVDEFSALVNEFKKDDFNAKNTLLVTSGDITIPGPRYFAAEQNQIRNITGSNEPGHADIAIANALGVDASAIGNHELDMGPGEFFDAAFGVESRNDITFPGSQFPWLATNIDFSSDGDFENIIAEDGLLVDSIKNMVAKYTIKVFGKDSVGIIGASGPTFPRITTTGSLVFVPGVEFTIDELAAEIQPSIDALKAKGVNKVILLSHMQQISIEKMLANKLDGVDIIVAGGSNARMGDDNDVLYTGDESFDEEYPFITNSDKGEPVAVVNVDGDYKYLGRLVVKFNSAGRIIPSSIDPAVSGAYATSAAKDKMPIAKVVEIRDSLRSVINAQFSNVIGYSSVYLDGRRSQVRTEETNLGNLTADANLWYANQLNPTGDDAVSVSIKNGGGIRTDIGRVIVPPGSNDPSEIQFLAPADNKVSEGNLKAVLRFDNGLVRLTVTAAELKDILEHAVAATAEGATPGQFPQVAGMKFTYNMNQPARTETGNGKRIIDLTITGPNGDGNDVVVENGLMKGDASRKYNLVTLNFLANGGDSYPFADLDSAAANRMNYYTGTGFGDPFDYQDANVTADPAKSSSFSYTGGEQDALAEYMSELYPETTPFNTAETAMDEDTRIARTSDVPDVLVSSISIEGANNITTDGGTTTVSVTVGPDNATNKSVTWTFDAGTTGATWNESTLTITASGTNSGNGQVTLTATAADGSGVSANATITISGQVEVISSVIEQRFVIYPNPSLGKFIVSSPVSGVIYNSLGMKIEEIGESTRIDLSRKSVGVYLLKTTEGKTYKLIVE